MRHQAESARAICHMSPLHIPQQGKNVTLAVPERPVYALHERHLQKHTLAFVPNVCIQFVLRISTTSSQQQQCWRGQENRPNMDNSLEHNAEGLRALDERISSLMRQECQINADAEDATDQVQMDDNRYGF